MLLDSIQQMQDAFTEDFNNVTVLAFRCSLSLTFESSINVYCSGGYRSEARVVSIRDGEEWKIIRSLALIADFGVT